MSDIKTKLGRTRLNNYCNIVISSLMAIPSTQSQMITICASSHGYNVTSDIAQPCSSGIPKTYIVDLKCYLLNTPVTCFGSS